MGPEPLAEEDHAPCRLIRTEGRRRLQNKTRVSEAGRPDFGPLAPRLCAASAPSGAPLREEGGGICSVSTVSVWVLGLITHPRMV